MSYDSGRIFCTLGESIDSDNAVWSNPTFIYANDNSFATTSSLGNGNTTSDSLRATGYGFAVPDGENVYNCLVYLRYKDSSSTAVEATLMQLTYQAATIGTRSDAGFTWTATEQLTTYNASGVGNWGMGDSLTPDIVNNTTFGVDLQVTWGSGNNTGAAQVDSIEMRVLSATRPARYFIVS